LASICTRSTLAIVSLNATSNVSPRGRRVQVDGFVVDSGMDGGIATTTISLCTTRST